MTRRRRPGRLEGMSGAGLLVVASLCLSLIVLVLTACGLTVYEAIVSPEASIPDLPPAIDRLLQGLLVAVPTLLAKAHADRPAAEPGDPTSVSAPPDATVTVTPPPPPPDPTGGDPVDTGAPSAAGDVGDVGDVGDDPPAVLALAGADGMALKVPPKKSARRRP